MAATYVTAPRIADAMGISAGGGTGLSATFALSAGLAGVALIAVVWARRRP